MAAATYSGRLGGFDDPIRESVAGFLGAMAQLSLLLFRVERLITSACERGVPHALD